MAAATPLQGKVRTQRVEAVLASRVRVFSVADASRGQRIARTSGRALEASASAFPARSRKSTSTAAASIFRRKDGADIVLVA